MVDTRPMGIRLFGLGLMIMVVTAFLLLGPGSPNSTSKPSAEKTSSSLPTATVGL